MSVKSFIVLVGAIVVAMILMDAWRKLRKNKGSKPSKTEPTTKEATAAKKPDSEKQAQSLPRQPTSVPLSKEVVAVHVMANNNPITGDDIIELAKKFRFHYGDYHIFHRYSEGMRSHILFSIASAIEPGTFELDNLERFSTAGLTFFMRLPDGEDALGAFDTMINVAKMVAIDVDGKLLDGDRQPLEEAKILSLRAIVAGYN